MPAGRIERAGEKQLHGRVVRGHRDQALLDRDCLVEPCQFGQRDRALLQQVGIGARVVSQRCGEIGDFGMPVRFIEQAREQIECARIAVSVCHGPAQCAFAFIAAARADQQFAEGGLRGRPIRIDRDGVAQAAFRDVAVAERELRAREQAVPFDEAGRRLHDLFEQAARGDEIACLQQRGGTLHGLDDGGVGCAHAALAEGSARMGVEIAEV